VRGEKKKKAHKDKKWEGEEKLTKNASRDERADPLSQKKKARATEVRTQVLLSQQLGIRGEETGISQQKRTQGGRRGNTKKGGKIEMRLRLLRRVARVHQTAGVIV